MPLGFKRTLFPTFLPGEQVRYVKPRLWLVSGKSLPSYRISFSLPPLVDMGAYVTDRRIILVANSFLLVNQQFGVWYSPHGNEDVLQEVGVSGARNSYVEIISEVPVESSLRSRQCRLRLYMRDAAAFASAVNSVE